MTRTYAALVLGLLLLGLSAAQASNGAQPSSTYAWGTYRPGVYFGVRARDGSSPLFGLLWGGPFSDVSHVEQLRHDAEERDHVTKYGWLQHDGKSFGVQEILDADKRVNITTTFLNVQCRTAHSTRHTRRTLAAASQ